jgi:O-antigen/teichoic acid export membrane protein
VASSQSSRLIRSILHQVGGRGIGLVLGFASLSLTARYMDEGAYGQLASALALVGLFTVLADFGVNSVVLRRANVDREDLNLLTRQSLGLTVIYVVPTCLAFLGIGYLLYNGAEYSLLAECLPAYAVGLAAACFSSSLRPLYQQQVRLAFTAVVEVATNVFTLTGYVVIITLHLSQMWIFYVQALYPLLGLILLTLGQRGQSLRPLVDRAEAWRLFRLSLPIGAGMVVAGLYLRVDMLILSGIAGTGAVAAYGLAYRVVSSIGVVSSYIASTLYPGLAALRNEERYGAVYTRSLVATLALVAPLAVGGALTAEPIIALIAGGNLSGASSPLRLLFVTLIPIFINTILGNALMLSNKGGWFLRMSLICLVLNIGLNFAVIPTYGATGAAAATLATELVTTGTLAWVMRADLRVGQFLSGFVRVAAATGVMAIAVKLSLSLPLAAVVAIGAAAWAVTAYAVKLHQDIAPTRTGRSATAQGREAA